MKKIVLAGAYGIQNAGDDAPMLVLKEALNHILDEDFTCTILARHVLDFDKSMFDAIILKNLEYESREASIDKWFSGLNFGDDRTQIEGISKEIKRADLLVIGAGNAFIDISIDVFRGPIPLMAIYCFLADLYRIPIVFYGVSVGPITSEWGRDLSQWMLDKASLVTVRDTQSVEYIKTHLNCSVVIQVLPDPVLGLKQDKLQKGDIDIEFFESAKASGKLILGIGLREIRSVVGTEERERVFLEIMRFLKANKQRFALVFIPNSTYPDDDDRFVAKEFVSQLEGLDVYAINERMHPGKLVSIYQYCDYTLAIRLHAAVFSVLAGVPVIAISYLPKVKGFISNVEQGAISVDIDELHGGKLDQCFSLLSKNKDTATASLSSYVDRSRPEVQSYFSQMVALIRE